MTQEWPGDIGYREWSSSSPHCSLLTRREIREFTRFEVKLERIIVISIALHPLKDMGIELAGVVDRVDAMSMARGGRRLYGRARGLIGLSE